MKTINWLGRNESIGKVGQNEDGKDDKHFVSNILKNFMNNIFSDH